jgi:hypothetical protein
VPSPVCDIVVCSFVGAPCRVDGDVAGGQLAFFQGTSPATAGRQSNQTASAGEDCMHNRLATRGIFGLISGESRSVFL